MVARLDTLCLLATCNNSVTRAPNNVVAVRYPRVHPAQFCPRVMVATACVVLLVRLLIPGPQSPGSRRHWSISGRGEGSKSDFAFCFKRSLPRLLQEKRTARHRTAEPLIELLQRFLSLLRPLRLQSVPFDTIYITLPPYPLFRQLAEVGATPSGNILAMQRCIVDVVVEKYIILSFAS